jgi:hypothetical protein
MRQLAGDVILWAVRWYCRYGISYRDLEPMLGERGVALVRPVESDCFGMNSTLSKAYWISASIETPVVKSSVSWMPAP